MELKDAIAAKDIPAIIAYMKANDLVLEDSKIVPASDAARHKIKSQVDFWDQRQLARKILLNSLYGALLNEGLRFHDPRLGQSTTLTGRMIVRHMSAKVNEAITGEYDHVGKSVIYGDTDSVYFTALPILKADPAYAEADLSRDSMVTLYDGVADLVNDSFPDFMRRSFHTTLERGAYIKAGRELVASKGLFIKKKKYAVLMYDKEGYRMDADGKPGKIKAMGLDLKRADTPKFMQQFLEKLLMDLLCGASKEDLFDQIRAFRKAFSERPGWEKGTPKKVSAVSDYMRRDTEAASKGGKVNIPGHIRAAMNWNRLCETNRDKYAMRISDGAKVVVVKLKPNLLRMDSVAYPIDEPHLPEWFRSLPFDHTAMEETIIDNKLENLLGVMGWDLNDTKIGGDDDFFTFG